MKVPKNKFVLLLTLVFVLLLILGVFYTAIVLIGGESFTEYLQVKWGSFKLFLLDNEIWLFVSLALLPGFVLPCAPLLLLVGIWGAEYGIVKACIYSISALTVNLIWTYWFAYGPGNSLVNKVLQKFGHEIPKLPSKNLLEWGVILRLTPGVPFIFSNYILGLLKMPFGKYLLVSVPIISITDCGFIFASAGIFGGGWKYIWAGVSILIVMIIGGRVIAAKKNRAD
ncbi:MAG: hypothetical protein HN553_10625 [Opitutae bacterium]|nr:hypothetical protein [Opitutae bacterium]